MKNSIIKYNKLWAFSTLVLTLAFVFSCTEDDAQSGPNDNLGQATVTVYNPDNGKEGAGVIISGTNFSTIASDNKVWFNGVEATVRSVSNTTILTSVPVGATTGSVTVSVKGKEAAAGPDFTVLLPTITALNPVKGGVGETVVLTGANYSTTPEENKVWFNGVEATVSAATATSITVTVPAGATTGTVSVQVKDGTVITGPSFEVTTEVTFEMQLTELNDDVEETVGPSADLTRWPIGYMDLNSSDLELGERDGDFGVQIIGMRYRNVTIPKNATIISAAIQFECDDTGAGPVNLRIHGENVGNSPENTDALFNTSSRPKTTASVLWTVEPWLAAGDRLPAQKTVDLKDIVQEIVNRGDWTANNAMNFIFTQEGANSSTGGDGREAETSKSTGKGATLTIVYE
ncbi:IPT/TIG domain-containing protein [Flavivirga spongiicola]|uniref:IPT/TIG domain-containing protein n=1 Tax=Flavivirga spongiicola TaxID=421621 RepID=A0ABU7XRA0_9FLAO|nr:IPT/TIG domain-containing protein [Flavivirga sp. MEBiC05379]MDO5977429.1 IPT/TIG domain-containing protein [Flavivirga sp. MEBiC05379]